MMRKTLGILSLLVLGGCGGASQLEAYIVPYGTGATTREQVAICYSGVLNDPADIQALLDRDCEGAKLLSNERNLGVCPLATPSMAVYSCTRINPDLLGQRPPMPLRPLKN